MRICLVAAEVTPFAKTGGLGDVVSGLARELARRGHDVRMVMPDYSVLRTAEPPQPVAAAQDVPLAVGDRPLRFSLRETRLPGTAAPVYLVACPPLYDRPGIYTGREDEAPRFGFLARATLEACQRLAWAPEVFHCNDWHAALLPLYLRTLYGWDRLFAESRTLLTIHNIAYQGIFPAGALAELALSGDAHLLHQEDLAAGAVNFLKTGILHAGHLSTVSRTHAREIQTEEYGMGLHPLLRARADHLVGIVNGVDYSAWDPASDRLIPHLYSRDDLAGKERDKDALLAALGLAPAGDAPVVGIVSRLTAQKGFELLFEVAPELLSRYDLRLAVLGSGESRYEEFFTRLAGRFRGRACFYRGFDERLAHLIEAGSDLFLMPSRYEPCGLNQMYSLRYGTVPVVRKTGGLADTVAPYDPGTGAGTGFVFEHFTTGGLAWAMGEALRLWPDRDRWRRLMRNGMAEDFSWRRQGDAYEDLYSRLLR